MKGVTLKTKLHIPSLRPTLVRREKLLAKLNDRLISEEDLFNRKLTLFSAPPGFGKTTLASSWIHSLNRPAAWLSLDEGDNDNTRFIHYLIAALQAIDDDIGVSAAALLGSPQPPSIDTLLTLVINDLASLSVLSVLVLDDYHVIQSKSIHEAVTFLIDHQPPQFHLVLISREDPPLPLHRLRGSGQMTGIYARDLRFAPREAAHFLNETMGLSLSSDEIAVLGKRTEGWVAGLQLAALSMQDLASTREFVTSFAGDDRYITDYLLGEVINKQPAQVQDFLLKTAITDRFCASLGDALMGANSQMSTSGAKIESCQEIIDRLDRRNLFIVPLDNKREWYRYHHLFAGFLRLRLRAWPATRVADLHRRAATWYAEHGHLEESVHHYLAIEDYPQAAALIEGVGIRLIVQGQLGKMLDWLAALPPDFVSARPLLCACHAWILTVKGEAAASNRLLQEAERALETGDNLDAQRAPLVRGVIEMVQAYRTRNQGNVLESIRLLSQSSQNLAPTDLFTRSSVNLNLGFSYLLIGQLTKAAEVLQVAREQGQAAGAVYITLIAMAIQANSLEAQGKLRQAIGLYEEAIADGLDRNHGRPFPPAGYAYAGLGKLMYERNQIEAAEQLLTEAIRLGESIADWSMMRRGLLPLAWLKQMAGEPPSAEEYWQKARVVVRAAGSARVEAGLEAQWVRLHLSQGATNRRALAEAIKWAESYQTHQTDSSAYQESMSQMTLAQVEMNQGKLNDAMSRLNQLAESAESGGQIDNLIKILALQALAYDAKGDCQTALKHLDSALTWAAPEGYVRTFVDHGPPMQRLLQQAANQSPISEYAASLLEAFPVTTQSAVTAARQELVEPLTERELSILRLIAAGRSNREIADQLFLSVNTVKVYASRSYAKLGVHRRGEAVAQARELGLL